MVDAYAAASVEATREKNKTSTKMIEREQGLRDGTLEVTGRQYYKSGTKYACKVGLKNVVTGETEVYTHACSVYGCTEDECLWLKSVMEDN